MPNLEAPWDLLSQPLFPVILSGEHDDRLSLPALLSKLQADDELRSFPTLLDHQQHALHAFLVQLAAIAIHRSGEDETAAPPKTWEQRLLALSGGQREPWCLVVEDLSKPAFMQPPVPEGKLDAFKKWGQEGTPFPDEIDMLVTAKNHDVKVRRIARPDPSHWIYALLTLQTMGGYSGPKNYGIARMNGGFASRPAAAYVRSLSPGSRFQRDLKVLLRSRESIVDHHSYSDRGFALLWLEPWDGGTSLPLHKCDPYFIEICRRMRLRCGEGGIRALGAPSAAARLESKEAKGNTGDPWTPLRLSKNGETFSLSVSRGGFGYRLIQAVLAGGDFQRGAALEFQPDDPPSLLFAASALVRGQGKTEGYYERMVPITPRVRRLLGGAEGREKLGLMAKARVDEVGDIKLRALKPALLQLLQGAPEGLNQKDHRADPFLERLENAVDSIFFEELWSSIEKEEEAGQGSEHDRWAEKVFELAESLLQEATNSLPVPDARRYRAIAAAERVFYGRKRNRLGPSRKESANA